jgi:ABC-type amino acid transport substrate-binding protein
MSGSGPRAHRSDRHRRRGCLQSRIALVLLAAAASAAAGLGVMSQPGRAEPPDAPQRVLRVGVVDGAQPCSDLEDRQWHGLAVELWSRLAGREGLPFVFEARPSAAAVLADVQRGVLDVGVGCLTITPERINAMRFSLPFQEMGLGVMQHRNRLEAGEAVLRSLISPDLLQLLAAYLASIALVSGLLWQCENHDGGEERRRHGRRRTFAKVFQILATGPGTNTIADTTRGHALVITSYLIRIVTASLLVTTITVKVVREPTASGLELRRLTDLEGLRVAARPGSVSEEVLRSLNRATPGRPPIRVVPLPQVSQAPSLLLQGLADAVLAEDLQLRYALNRSPRRGLVISLQGLQRESQAFALSAALPAQTAARINQGLSALKRSGVVSELQREAVNKS